MTTSRQEQTLKALNAVMQAVCETVEEAGDMGAPSGPVYAALMHFGISLDVYNHIIAALVQAGKIRQSGNVLYTVKRKVT